MPVCAICQHLAVGPRTATGTVGLLTREPGIVEAALDRLGADGEEHHVLVHTCPEHAVDVYRGRVEGVKMAWQLGEQSAIPPRRSLSATSASRA